MGNLKEHAEREFEIAGWKNKDKYEDRTGQMMQNQMMSNILELIDVIEKQGHSGTTFNYVMSHFERLARFKPITVLTGEDSEWHDPGGSTLQNKRCSSVFKDKEDGKCYDISAKAFRGPDGFVYGCGECHVDVEFPYEVPVKFEIVDVDETGKPIS